MQCDRVGIGGRRCAGGRRGRQGLRLLVGRAQQLRGTKLRG